MLKFHKIDSENEHCSFLLDLLNVMLNGVPHIKVPGILRFGKLQCCRRNNY